MTSFDGGNRRLHRAQRAFNQRKDRGHQGSSLQPNICAAAFPDAGPLTQHATVTHTHKTMTRKMSTHASPRLHDRRGHWRKHPACMVRSMTNYGDGMGRVWVLPIAGAGEKK